MATPCGILTALDAQISGLISTPSTITDYKFGEKSVSRSQALSGLLKARELYQELCEKSPAEDISHIALDFDEFGVDVSEYIGDAV